jgi:hypothetical protein
MSNEEWARAARAKVKLAQDAKDTVLINVVKQMIDSALENKQELIKLDKPITGVESMALRRAYIVLAQTTDNTSGPTFYRFEIVDPSPRSFDDGYG